MDFFATEQLEGQKTAGLFGLPKLPVSQPARLVGIPPEMQQRDMVTRTPAARPKSKILTLPPVFLSSAR
jgi:hypothetical protein